MKHVESICAYIKALLNNNSFHALIIESPPGWGKSTTVNRALAELEIQAVAAGAYATPLHIYNTLCRHPNDLIVLDDCAGIFNDTKSMSILKAATWPGSGSGTGSDRSTERRQVAWGSISEKVEQPSVDFNGKLILLTNVIPAGKETEAFITRCFRYRICVEPGDIRQMLLLAAESSERYPNRELAIEVANFIADDETAVDLTRVNLRTLGMGYVIAETHPEGWRKWLVPLLPRREKQESLISQILKSGLSAREQEERFMATTGKSRRTFYNYKKRFSSTRSDQIKTDGE